MIQDLEKLLAEWARRSRKEAECGERTEEEMGKRVMAHGATIYLNCYLELKAVLEKHAGVIA